MAYSYLTFAQLRIQLASRLGDLQNIYWTDAELGMYVREAMRTWQSMTQFWRERMPQINLVQNQNWYDITTPSNSLLKYFVRDNELMNTMLYQLIEPPLLAGSYVGTSMFTMPDFQGALDRRRNQFLLETGMITTRIPSIIATPTVGRIVLPDTVVDVKRAAWIDANGVYSTLWKTDEWAANTFQRGWENAPRNPPTGYSVGVAPPVTLGIIPAPSDVGQVELITVSTGVTLNPSAGVLLGIPDDLTWVVRMGAMADLLAREGESRDPEREQYCLARWKEGIELAKMYTAIVAATINGVQVVPQTVQSMANYRPNWQNEAAGVPDSIGIMSWNLIALAPMPDAGPYALMLDVIRNCPVPVLDSDFIQMGREDLDAILDYSQHLAAFKQGGDEFMASAPLYHNAIARAKAVNAKLTENIPFYDPLSNRGTRQAVEAAVGGAPINT